MSAWFRQLQGNILLFAGASAILVGSLGCSGDAFSSDDVTDDASGAPGTGGGQGDALGVVDDTVSTVDASLPKDAAHPIDATTGGPSDAAVDVPCAVRDACPSLVALPTGALELWLSADFGVTLANQRVTRWQDRSGVGNDATQPDPAVRPSVMSDWHGGNPAITFDAISSVLVMPSGFADFSKGLSLFVVADVTSDQNCPSFVEFSNGGEVDDVTLQETSGVFLYEVADKTCESPADQVPRNKPLLMEVVHSATEEMLLLSNGVVLTATSLPLPNMTTRFKNELGRSSYADCTLLGGHIAEVILYRRGLDSSERLIIEDYLRRKWKL